jgi:hypothetical protein
MPGSLLSGCAVTVEPPPVNPGRAMWSSMFVLLDLEVAAD